MRNGVNSAWQGERVASPTGERGKGKTSQKRTAVRTPETLEPLVVRCQRRFLIADLPLGYAWITFTCPVVEAIRQVPKAYPPRSSRND